MLEKEVLPSRLGNQSFFSIVTVVAISMLCIGMVIGSAPKSSSRTETIVVKSVPDDDSYSTVFLTSLRWGYSDFLFRPKPAMLGEIDPPPSIERVGNRTCTSWTPVAIDMDYKIRCF